MKLFPPARLPFLKRMITSGAMSEQQAHPGVAYAMMVLGSEVCLQDEKPEALGAPAPTVPQLPRSSVLIPATFSLP